MSHSTPSGERPPIPSPRPLQAKPANNAPTSSSRSTTAGTNTVEAFGTFAPITPAGPRDASRQQYDYSQTPIESAPQPQSRGFGVHSILNPSSEVIQHSPITTPRLSTAATGQTLLPPPTSSPRSRKRAEPASPTRTQAGGTSGTSGRRILTPKSPATRAASTGGRRNLTFYATGPPSQILAGPEPRIYTAEPGSSDIPSLPPISSAARASLPALHSTDVWQTQGRPQGAGPSVNTTQTASPSTSHTSQSQTDQTSPAFRYGQMPASQAPPPQYRAQHFGMQMGYSSEHGLRGGPDSYQAGQTGYQMTLETDQGPMVVPVELDLQQASKMADEKRKRNAGASARFRARRKEKEKEASHTISSLQQELRELREAREFYRNERNYIRDYAIRQAGLQLPPRPPSPVFHRVRAPSSYDEGSGMEDIGRARSDSAPVAQRRRTGDYLPRFPAASQQSPIPQPFTYPPNPPMPLHATQVQGHAPGPHASPRSLPPGPPGSAAPSQRSQSAYDPFRKDPFDRSWNPAR